MCINNYLLSSSFFSFQVVGWMENQSATQSRPQHDEVDVVPVQSPSDKNAATVVDQNSISSEKPLRRRLAAQLEQVASYPPFKRLLRSSNKREER